MRGGVAHLGCKGAANMAAARVLQKLYVTMRSEAEVGLGLF
jgi:hypothetical protein